MNFTKTTSARIRKSEASTTELVAGAAHPCWRLRLCASPESMQ